MTRTSPDIPTVIAAGGNGSRIGGGKPDLMLGGISLIDRAVAQARSWSGHIAVAVRKQPQPALPAGIDFLIDAEENRGPLSALSSALTFAQAKQADHVMMIACDMPFLPVDLTQRLAAKIELSPVAIARCDGQLHPICALWATSVLTKLADYAATGRRSLIGFAETIGMVGVDWNRAEPDPFFNINTPQDLQQAEAFLRQNPSAQT